MAHRHAMNQLLAVIAIAAACGLSVSACTDGTARRSLLPMAAAAATQPVPVTLPADAGNARRPTVAMVIALPLSYTGTVLDRLADNGRASGFQLAGHGQLPLPLSASPVDVVMASDRNFFDNDRLQWTQLATASSNSHGLLAGHGVAAGEAFVWTWDGTPALRYPVPAGFRIQSVVGPSDDGSVVADIDQPDTNEQQILLWQRNGSRSLLYRNMRAKAGMQLFGIASNGIVGAIERDGLLLTPRLYDGLWHTLPFDYLNCGCEARRVNARGEVLMSPLPDRGGDPQGYLVSRGGATLLPRAAPDTTYTDLNDLGDVIGQSGGRPVMILDGVLHDLNAYAGDGAAGWQFLTATAISGRRQILGAGLWQGQTRWYRLNLR